MNAEIRLFTVAVQTMRLALVPQEARRRRKARTFAGLCLATVWLQVRVNKFAWTRSADSPLFLRVFGVVPDLLVVALELLGLVVA